MTGELRRGAAKSGEGYVPCSIVIRAYNEEAHIGRLLDGVLHQSLKDLEVVLVDSGSTDGTVRIAESINGHLPVKVVRIQPEKFTFGHSLNQGIANASSDFVIVASAHIYPVYPDWLERLLAPLSDPQVALAYGKQRGNATNHFSEHQIFARWYPEQSQPRQSHPFCNNANAAIRRSLWEQHPYDESLSGLEDVAWARWAMEQGYAIAYVAEAEVVHVHDETPRAVFNRYRREAMAYKRIFPQEAFHFWDFIRLYASNVASDLWHAARQRVLLSQIKSILWFRLMQFWGTYQGYHHSGPLTWQLRKTFYYPRGIGSEARPLPRDVEPIRYKDVAEKP
jgi:rhamnosyltransferase